ncbi:Protein FAR1-RELATED SEQUENCE 5 [Zea mays]|uniref:Protein FAR1-RELATED SEQUENCE n=1 Tax=Zea mays TaxID=4577 RepID=A0A1D6JEB2_MAIZE|nr:Protein FAR1-RELATED SEQUENCE 5 [Zea mays]
MATPSTAGDPAPAGEPVPTPLQGPAQRRISTSRISHIVRTYLDLSSSRKRRSAPKNQPKAGDKERDAAAAETDGSKAGPSSSHPSRLLRELGIRVSRYTHEERRDIILRYMQKRSGRQIVNRAANKLEEKAEEEPELPPEVVSNAGGVPIVGMVFESEEKAYEYYVSYAGNMGFSVRKGWWEKTAKNSNRSRVYVCSREGFRSKNDTKKPRSETRVGCPARIAIKVARGGKYRVTEFVEDHNHQLAAPFDIEMLKSQRMLTKVRLGSQNASNIPPGKECEQSMDCMAYGCGEFGSFSEYMITIKNKSKDQLVRFDSSDASVACTCKKFENSGLLCCHILKVYELRNIKEIPPQYFLKRWRKDAKLVMDETDGFNFDTKSSIPGRYAALCRLFYRIAAKAAENEETFALMASQSDNLLVGVERTLLSTLSDKSSGHSLTDQLTRMAENDYLLSGGLEGIGSTGKKCEVARRRNGLDTNKRKKAKKGQPDATDGGPTGRELNIGQASFHSEPSNASNQFIPDQLMQGHYVLGHNFGPGSSHNLHDNLNQFDQGYPGDMHALQFVEPTPQIDHQNGDEGQSSIPVWDFL